MHTSRDGKFERTDIWREGKWLDLWSVVHLLSGVTIGLGFYFLNFDAPASVVLALLSLVSYEMWEVMVRIEETRSNRFMDVLVGMASFLPTFFFLAPSLSGVLFIFLFYFVLALNGTMSVFGWVASHKAAALEERMRARYMTERARLLERGARLHKKFRYTETRTKKHPVKSDSIDI